MKNSSEAATEHISVDPMNVACPRCHAEPAAVCESELGKFFEIINIERIEAAITSVAEKAEQASLSPSL
jgi:hypothetical protein